MSAAGVKIKNRGISGYIASVLKSAKDLPHEFDCKVVLAMLKGSAYEVATETEVGNALYYLIKQNKLKKVSMGMYSRNGRAKHNGHNETAALDEALEALVTLERVVKRYKRLQEHLNALNLEG